MNNLDEKKYKKYKKKYLLLKAGSNRSRITRVIFKYQFPREVYESVIPPDLINLPTNGLTFFQDYLIDLFIKYRLNNNYLLCGAEYSYPKHNSDYLSNNYDIFLYYGKITGSSLLPEFLKHHRNPPKWIEDRTCNNYLDKLDKKVFNISYSFTYSNNFYTYELIQNISEPDYIENIVVKYEPHRLKRLIYSNDIYINKIFKI